jgi:hypothetical protein
MISSEVSAQSGRENEGPAAGEEQWFVATAAGIRPMTTEAIEQAFERGTLDASAQVWTSGMLTWESLGLIAELNDSPTHQGAGAEARARAATTEPPLGDRSLVDRSLGKPPKSRRAEPFSYPPPVPGLGNLNEGLLASVIPPPPASMTTRLRQRVAAVSSGAGARQLGTWFVSRLTWQAWLFSAVAGTALGLFLYQNVVRGFWTGSASASAAESQLQSAPQTAQNSLLASDPNSAKRANTPGRDPAALDAPPIATANAPVAAESEPVAAESAPLEAIGVDALPESTQGLADAVDPPSSTKRSAKARARAKAKAKYRAMAMAKAKAKRAQTKRSKPAATKRSAKAKPAPYSAPAPYSRH